MTTLRGRPPSSPVPQISTSIDEEDNFDDVMTADEENAALRYLSSDTGGKIHRLSSLDVYLLSEKSADNSESFLLNRRKSIRIEEEQANQLIENMEQKTKEERQKIIEETKQQIKEERERKKLEREEALKKKHEIEQKNFSRCKKKGLGGMSREKRNRLKKLIMQKVHEEMISERHKYEKLRKQAVENVVPKLNIENSSSEDLIKICHEFYDIVKDLESKNYDIQQKIQWQENELNELTRKLSELPGKYPIPILKKVSKQESRLAKLLRSRAASVGVSSPVRTREASTENLERIHECDET